MKKEATLTERVEPREEFIDGKIVRYKRVLEDGEWVEYAVPVWNMKKTLAAGLLVAALGIGAAIGIYYSSRQEQQNKPVQSAIHDNQSGYLTQK